MDEERVPTYEELVVKLNAESLIDAIDKETRAHPSSMMLFNGGLDERGVARVIRKWFLERAKKWEKTNVG